MPRLTLPAAPRGQAALRRGLACLTLALLLAALGRGYARDADEPEAAADAHPFPRRVAAPPLEGGVARLNSDRPLRLADLRGKFVLLEVVDLVARRVSTVAGTGKQARSGPPGLEKLGSGNPGPPVRLPDRWVAAPATARLNSPWALWVHQNDLDLAMAGSHQIWKMPLDAAEIGAYAGNGREDIVDGPRLPAVPYQQGDASRAGGNRFEN